MSLGTRCHQLGMYVVFESPLQMLSDSPSNYLREPEMMEFLAPVPSVWDDTKVLDARIAEYALVARRSGKDWYVGAMTNWTGARTGSGLLLPACGDFLAGSVRGRRQRRPHGQRLQEDQDPDYARHQAENNSRPRRRLGRTDPSVDLFVLMEDGRPRPSLRKPDGRGRPSSIWHPSFQ